ncbi:MAG: Nramp family divalent metal transporter [Pirellulales bacterium]
MKPTTDAGCLPAWTVGDLPDPLPFSFANAIRTIGPGAILLAGSIGGGEWIVGPTMTVQYGAGILWVATVAIALQTVFNMEAVRYTMVTGEPILTGIMRLSPGPRLWGPLYILLAVVQIGAPAIAAGCAAVLFAAFAGRVPAADGADRLATGLITAGLVIGAAVLLLSGKKVERTLERLSWMMVIFIFTFLVAVNLVFVPLATWAATARGFVTFGYWPTDMNLLALAAFASLAGSGGVGNLAISNWFRDKGFGMGKYVGGIGGYLAHGEDVRLAPVGCMFRDTPENRSRWRDWWRYARIDQMALWAVGCLCGMFLNVNLAVHIVPPGSIPNEQAMGTMQAEYLANAWSALWPLALLNGFWILFSTQLGNADALVRVSSDVLWAGFPRVQRWSPSRLYAVILVAVSAFGLVAINLGSVMSLFRILGAAASIVMAITAVQILRVNTRFLPPEVRPRLWRRLALLACACFYGAISSAVAWSQIKSLLGW